MLANLVKSPVAFQGKVTDLSTGRRSETTKSQNDTILTQLNGALEDTAQSKLVPGQFNKGLDNFSMLIGDEISLQKNGQEFIITVPKNNSNGELQYKLDLTKDGSQPVAERFKKALQACLSDMKMVTDTVNDLKNLKDKKIFVRVDFNVPLNDKGEVTNDNRIKEALPTIKNLIDKGAKVIIASHLGKPKGKVVDSLKMDPVADKLRELLHQDDLYSNVNVKKVDDCVGPDVNLAVNTMERGSIVVLENLRFHPEEEKNDSDFSKELGSLADIYVNDAFGAAHRAHASTKGITNHVLRSVAGKLMHKELTNLGEKLQKPEQPFVAIVGGSKVSSKIGVLDKLAEKVNTIIIGGGMLFTFLAAQGKEVGKSLVEADKIQVAKDLMDKAKRNGVKLVLAKDVKVAPADYFAQLKEGKTPDPSTFKTVSVDNIPKDMMGLDVASETSKEVRDEILEAKTIIWNGPMGVFEQEAFEAGTKDAARAVVEATKNGAVSILGGGDTVAAIDKFGMDHNLFTHVSTGGGASLEFLEGKELPGVKALDTTLISE